MKTIYYSKTIKASFKSALNNDEYTRYYWASELISHQLQINETKTIKDIIEEKKERFHYLYIGLPSILFKYYPGGNFCLKKRDHFNKQDKLENELLDKFYNDEYYFLKNSNKEL